MQTTTDVKQVIFFGHQYIIKTLVVVFGCMLFSLPMVAVSEGSDAIPMPAQLLSLMASAVRENNYQGEFTYEYSGNVNAYQITHAVIDGIEREKIYPLNGTKTEIVRSGRSLDCGTIGGKLLSGLKITSSDGLEFSLENNYHFVLREKDRIADSDAWVMQLVPRDEHRLGVSVALDSSSYLPLRYLVFNSEKKLVERLQFVSLKNNVPLTHSDFAIDKAALNIVTPSSLCVKDSYTPAGHSPWKPAWLPRGFLHTGYSYSEDDGYMETYTDGLGAFSIFVKPIDVESGQSNRLKQGVAQKGASVAILNIVPIDSMPLQVSVVGEIPRATAQKIALSLRKFIPHASRD